VTNAPRPGWYPDPAGTADSYRWWDGDQWTDSLSSSPSAPAPDGNAVAPAGPPRRRSAFRAAIALLVIVALFLSAGVGVGLWLWGDGVGRTDAGRTSAPTPPQAGAASPSAAPGQLDQRSRTATIGSVSMDLPGEPYELHGDPMSVAGVFDVAFVAEAEVHEEYDGDNDWYAMVGLAGLDPDLVDGAELTHTGAATMRRLVKLMYGKHPVKITDARWADRSVDGYPGVEYSARVNYAIDRLPSRYDTVSAVVVRLDEKTVVVAVGAVPDGADREVARQAAESLDSLRIN
jgi:Protein of unknown function (DUF2510)